MPVDSKELKIWRLTTTWPSKGPLYEVLVKGSLRNHVDEAHYKDAKGKYRCVVKLKVKDGAHHESHASGVLIEPDLVLTSAHNVLYYNGDHVSRAIAVKAYTGYHRQCSSFKETGDQMRFGRKAIVLQKWARPVSASRNDMALIKLESRFTQVEPALYRAPPSTRPDVLVVGYPGENTRQARGSTLRCRPAGCMYEVAGRAKLNSDKMLEYRLSTTYGNSGGPVFLDSMPMTVIATHTRGDLGTEINSATPVDVAFIEATKALLTIPDSSSRENVVMHQQGWSMAPPKEAKPGRTTAPSSSKARHRSAPPSKPDTKKKREENKVSDWISDQKKLDKLVFPGRKPRRDDTSTQRFNTHFDEDFEYHSDGQHPKSRRGCMRRASSFNANTLDMDALFGTNTPQHSFPNLTPILLPPIVVPLVIIPVIPHQRT